MKEKQSALKNLPSVDSLLKSSEIAVLLEKHPRSFVLGAIRKAIDAYREGIRNGSIGKIETEGLLARVKEELDRLTEPHLRPVINATGIVIHTNLGRAPLSPPVLENVVRIAEGYSNLEYDLEKGARGKRYSHIKTIINRITGAEDCLVVNNNAAAVLLCLSALAKGKEVIVSRGEMVEIGGAFRIPDVMAQSGAVLKEVGATNKTRVSDYEKAITDETALILKVHKSNFRVTGFTEEASVEELVELGGKHSLRVMYDLGSGCLVDLRPLGIHDEPMVQSVVETGVDITTFSGDKLLGGPQAGVIIGKADLIQAIQKHPLTRAVRVDKFTLAALESVFRLYADPESAKKEVPVLKMLFSSGEALKIRARRLASGLRKSEIAADITMNKDRTKAGGGSLPEIEFPTWTVSVRPHEITVNQLEERLRKAKVPVIGRIQNDRFIFDLMTVRSSQVRTIIESVQEAVMLS